MTDENFAPDPIKQVPKNEQIIRGEIILTPRQIKNGTLRWSHFGPMAETATAIATGSLTIGPINGKYYKVNVTEL